MVTKEITKSIVKVFAMIFTILATVIVLTHIIKVQREAARLEKLRADAYFPQDESGHSNDSVYAFRQCLEDRGYYDVSIAIYPISESPGGHHQTLMWSGMWQMQQATISIETEIVPISDGTSDYTDIQSWIVCRLANGSIYSTTRATDQDIVMDCGSPILMNRSTFEAFLNMMLKKERFWGITECPLADTNLAHFCESNKERIWHKINE